MSPLRGRNTLDAGYRPLKQLAVFSVPSGDLYSSSTFKNGLRIVNNQLTFCLPIAQREK